MKKEEMKKYYLKWVEGQAHLMDNLEGNPILDKLFNMDKTLRYELFRDFYNGAQDFPSLMELAGHLLYCKEDDGELNLTATYIGPINRVINLPSGESKLIERPGFMFCFFVASGDTITEEKAMRISGYNPEEKAKISGYFYFKSKQISVDNLMVLIDKLNEKKLILNSIQSLGRHNLKGNKEYTKARSEITEIIEENFYEKI